jgi:hypothetical protein
MTAFLASHDIFASQAENLIQTRLLEYKQAYPEIEFIALYTSKEFEELLPLTLSLGEGLSNLDYEHPEELRITLVEAQEFRITEMLKHEMGSATFFKTSNPKVTNKPYACLITLNNSLHSNDKLSATRFMYDLDDVVIESMPQSLVLDNQEFMLYSVDHEIFHCIDAYVQGPMYPRTFDPIEASHNRRLAELRVEIFASMAHLVRFPDRTGLIKGISIARAINLLSGDAEHFTSHAINKLLMKKGFDVGVDLPEMVNKAILFADITSPTYEEHKAFLVALSDVIPKFGLSVNTAVDYYALLVTEIPDQDLVDAINQAIRKGLETVNTSQNTEMNNAFE